MSVFSERLIQCLNMISMSQKTLAEKTEITPATISRYITGQRNPSAENVNRISKVLNVSVDYLLGRDNNDVDPIISAVSDDKELLDFTRELMERESMQLLFRQVKPLKDTDINKIIKIIKAIEDEEDRENEIE